MAVKNKTDLKAKIDTDIVTNATRSITASVVNSLLQDMADSMSYISSSEIVSKAANFSFSLTDAGKLVDVNSDTNITATILNDSDLEFNIGTKIDIFQYQDGQVIITPASGVTLRSFEDKFKTAGVGAIITIRKRAANDWVMYGDTAI